MGYIKDASNQHAEVFKFDDDNDVVILLLPLTEEERWVTPEEFDRMVEDVKEGISNLRGNRRNV